MPPWVISWVVFTHPTWTIDPTNRTISEINIDKQVFSEMEIMFYTAGWTGFQICSTFLSYSNYAAYICFLYPYQG